MCSFFSPFFSLFFLGYVLTNMDDSNFTVDQIRALMDKPTNIRNMSVIAHGMLPIFHLYAHI